MINRILIIYWNTYVLRFALVGVPCAETFCLVTRFEITSRSADSLTSDVAEFFLDLKFLEIAVIVPFSNVAALLRVVRPTGLALFSSSSGDDSIVVSCLLFLVARRTGVPGALPAAERVLRVPKENMIKHKF